MPSRHVPNSWELTEVLKDYARDKGFSDKQIDDMEEACRCYEFKRKYHCWDRVWQRWVRRAVEMGNPIPENRIVEYRGLQEVSEDQLAQDRLDFENDPKIRAFRAKRSP